MNIDMPHLSMVYLANNREAVEDHPAIQGRIILSFTKALWVFHAVRRQRDRGDVNKLAMP